MYRYPSLLISLILSAGLAVNSIINYIDAEPHGPSLLASLALLSGAGITMFVIGLKRQVQSKQAEQSLASLVK